MEFTTMIRRWIVGLMVAMTFMVNMPTLVLAQASGDSTPSELSQQGVSLKTGFQTSEKGIFSNTTEVTRPDGYAAVLDNLHTNKDGVWTNKGHGWELQNGSAFNSGQQFVEITAQSALGRGETIIMQVGDQVLAYDGTTTWDMTGDTVPTTTAHPCIRSFINTGGNYFLFCNGQTEPSHGYNVTTPLIIQPATGPEPPGTRSYGFPATVGGIAYSKPTLCEQYYGRGVFAGFPIGSGFESTIVISSDVDAEDFTVQITPTAGDAGAISMPAVLGPIVGLCPLRVGNGSNDQVMLVGCTKGIGILTGSDSTNFAVKELTHAYGIYNNRTWVSLGDNILFLATDGIRRIANSAYGANVVGTPVSYPVQDLYNRINLAATDQVFAFNNAATQELEFWIPIDGNTQCLNAIVANYRTSTGQDLIFSTMSGVSGACGVYISNAISGGAYKGAWIGGYDGFLQNWWSGFDDGSGIVGPLDYGGTPIHWRYVSNIIGANSFAQNASIRKFVIVCDGGQQQFQATAFAYVTNIDGTTRRQNLESKFFTYEQFISPQIATWSEALNSNITHLHPAMFDFAPRGSGRLWFVELQGNNAGDTIDLVGIQSIQTVGGLKQ